MSRVATSDGSITFNVWREEIQINTMAGRWKAPDLMWSIVDSAGHLHRYNELLEVATLGFVVTSTTWEGDEYESYEVEHGEWRCRRCGELVEPGMRWEYDYPIAGPLRCTVIVRTDYISREFELTAEQFAYVNWIGRDEAHLERYIKSLEPEACAMTFH